MSAYLAGRWWSRRGGVELEQLPSQRLDVASYAIWSLTRVRHRPNVRSARLGLCRLVGVYSFGPSVQERTSPIAWSGPMASGRAVGSGLGVLFDGRLFLDDAAGFGQVGDDAEGRGSAVCAVRRSHR